MKARNTNAALNLIPGRGQLTLVEHALCPLDPQRSLVENLVHHASYGFMDNARTWRKAQARVFCPLGLSASDELYLWGLLALTFAEEDNGGELHATPHFCLKRLGVIDEHCRSGGHYQRFARALERLSAVRYQNDRFYDPVRSEHRRVSFGFFSYSLPLDPKSSRAWRIAWDPIFFEFAKASSGHLRFDLGVYRQLDPATRRLFLLLSKIFHRMEVSPPFDLRALGVDVLGFSPELCARDLKRKVARCVRELQRVDVVAVANQDILFQKKAGTGRYAIRLARGRQFSTMALGKAKPLPHESALYEQLRSIGLENGAIMSVLRKYPTPLLREWADITLAAIEGKAPGFFKRSAAAYFVDNVKHAAAGVRTPPDWWLMMRKAEREGSGAKRTDNRGLRRAAESVSDIMGRMVKEHRLPIDVNDGPTSAQKAPVDPASKR